MTAKLLFFAGSTRKGSLNKQLTKYVADYAASKGADVTLIDLEDYALPLFCEDLEAAEGMPENVKKLKALLRDHDGFFIATPEYNSLMPALLKNVIDWCSRSESTGEASVFQGKIAGLASATPGAMGGIRGLPILRSLLQNIGVMVVPNQVAFGFAGKAYDDAGKIADEGQRAMVHGVVDQLINTAEKMKG